MQVLEVCVPLFEPSVFVVLSSDGQTDCYKDQEDVDRCHDDLDEDEVLAEAISCEGIADPLGEEQKIEPTEVDDHFIDVFH